MTISIVILARLFLSAVALVLALMAAVSWSRRRRASEATTLSLLMVSAAIYCFGYSGEVAQTNLADAMLWFHVEYFGICWIPALLVLLTQKHNHLRSRLGLLLVIPLLTFVAQETTPWHGLFDRSLQMQFQPPFWIVAAHRGPIAWLFVAYMYAALLYSSWIYISRFRTSSRLFQKQSLLFVTSFLPPLAGNLVYLCGWSPWGLDMAPAMMGISAILGYFAAFRLEFFELVPMARSLVFNNMRDAALVTDMRRSLVDFNPAARKLLPSLRSVNVGDEITTAFPASLCLQTLFSDPKHSQKIELRAGGELQHFEVRILPLLMEKHQAGWAVILANITAQVRLVHELRHEAETDELTGVANRRSFTTAIEREQARSVRYGTIFSILVIDIDLFKSINDHFGHLAGDFVLSTVTARIASCLRCTDLLCRYGGDEFAILLPETGAESAIEVAERICNAIANEPVEMESQNIRVSSSIGIATYDPAHTADWEQVLDEADHALYRAKAEGRNRVALACSPSKSGLG
jgi:diguanylate cyclase (GGDEF)-like protein